MEKEGLILSKNQNENVFFVKRDISGIKLSEIESVVMNRSFYKNFNNSLEFQKLYEKLTKIYYNRKDDIILYRILKND